MKTKLTSRNDATTVSSANYEQFSYFYDNGHSNFIQRANRVYDFVRGRQWAPEDEQKLKAVGRPALTINQLLPTYAVILGEFLANRADVTFLPAKEGQAEVADALTKLWLHTANQNKLDWLEMVVVERGLLTGRGFFDLRVEFDDHMQGEVRVRTPRPQSVLLDPDMDSPFVHDWPQVIESRWLTLTEVEMTYGKQVAERVKYLDPSFMLGSQSVLERPGRKHIAEAAGGDPAYTKMYRTIDRQHRQIRYGDWFVDTLTGHMSEVPDTWERNRISAFLERYPDVQVTKRRYKDIRWTVSIDNVLLHDDWSPYNEFTIVPYMPFFLDGEPVSLFEQLLGSQELLNKTTSQELHILNTSSNSGWKVKQGALANMTVEDLEARGAETGLVIEVAGDPDADIVKLTPNNVPTGHDRMSYKAEEHIKSISLVSDTMRGFDREDVSSKAILAKQARGSVSLALAFSAMNMCRHQLAERSRDMYQGFYTEHRMLAITGGSVIEPSVDMLEINAPTPEGEIAIDLTLGEYSVVVAPAPARTTINDSEFNELVKLRELGVPVPADAFLEASHIPNKKRLLMAIRQLAGGQDPAAADAQQRAAEQQLQDLEIQLAMADAQVRQANANLANARAQKIATDAANVPNEQALKVAAQQAQQERDRMQSLLDARRLELQDRTQRTKQAIDMAKVEMESEDRAADREVQAKAVAVTKATKKSGAKKPAKKATPTTRSRSKR